MNGQHANVHRKLYPRKAKALVNYKIFNEEGIKEKEMTEVNKAEMTGKGAVGEEDEMDKSFNMTDKEFVEFKEKIKSLEFTDEETDEETAELMKKLKDIKKKEKVKKRKLALKAELEKRVKELEELEEMENDEKKEKKKGTMKEKGKDKDKKKTKNKVIGEELFKKTSLDIKDLRTDKHLQKVVEKHMKKLLNNKGSDTDSVSSESDVSHSGESKVNSSIDSSSDYSSSSEQESNSDSCYKKKAHKHKKETKKHKVRSGIKDRPHDKVKVKMNWPQSELKYEFTNRKAVEFKQLSLSQFCAGELEIIRHCKISKTEKEGRLAFLNKIMYYANEFEWSVLLNFYAAWVKLIEKGENTWGDDTCLLEVRMLIGKRIINKNYKGYERKFSNSSNERKFSNISNDKAWYCPLYQKNKCKIAKESHTLDIAGKNRIVQHICASCLREDNVKLRHPECSTACPHMQ